MKYRKWMTVGAALAFLFTAQPVYAAPVIVAGAGAPGTEGTQTAGEQQAQETVTQAPGQTAESGVSQAPAQTAENPAQNEAAAVQSPTVVSGQGQNAPGSTGSDSGAPTSNGKATFFMVGERVGSYKTEVQRMVAEGHEVANHTMNHKYLQKLGAAQIQAQVNNGNDAIQAACGVRPTLLRLPGGNHNSTVVANVGMPMIQWNVDTLDWKTRNADKTVAAVLNHVKDGDIILMHELYGATGDAVARIVPELHKRGFQMVTVSQMAAAKGRSLETGKLYSSFN